MVSGEDAYKEAKDFMRMLMPSHAKNVQPYKDKDQPLLHAEYRHREPARCDLSTQVTLKSGGYIVINQTEALVAIDVNSGQVDPRAQSHRRRPRCRPTWRRPTKWPGSCGCATSPA